MPHLRWMTLITVLSITQTARPLCAQAPPLTINEVRTLSTSQLARAQLGERLGARVIEAVRRDYPSSPAVPSSVDFYTQPEAPWPRINRICRTDVITVEFNWFDVEHAQASTPLTMGHVEATSRYLAFPDPPGEPGTPEYDQRHVAACLRFHSALDAFRAPDAGDAQWLASLESQWSQPFDRLGFALSCDDFADSTCGLARRSLAGLRLHRAVEVRRADCPPRPSQRRDQVNYCYQLTFNYADSDNPEWVLNVVGGMRDGMAPVEIRALRIEHVRPARNVF